MQYWTMGIGAIVVIGATTLWYRSSGESERRPSGASEGSEIAALRAELGRLKQRVAANDLATTGLAAHIRASDETRRMALQAATVATSGDALAPAEPEVQAPPPRPTIQQQMANFHRHFAALDALRGNRPDVPLEGRFRDLLTNSEASKLPALSRATVDGVSCGNELCRVEVTFQDVGVARLGQTELQIQLGPLMRGASMYIEPGSNQLHAYVATGETPMPQMPALEARAAEPQDG